MKVERGRGRGCFPERRKIIVSLKDLKTERLNAIEMSLLWNIGKNIGYSK